MLHVTRESRLAVVVGFSLVLVVGVLISDHLSRAREAEPGYGLTDTERETLEPVRLLKEAPRQPRAQRREQQPTDPTAQGLDSPDATARGTEELEPSRPRSGTGTNTATDTAAGLTNTLDPPPTLTMGGSDSAADRAQPADARNRLFPLFVPVDPDRSTDPPPRAAAPAWHTVSKGETLYAIAQTYLGHGNRWREIARANPARVGEDGTVRAGVRLRLPEDADPTAPASTAAPDAEPRTIEYTVKPGEVFSVLAQRFMGTVRRQDELLELNRGRIDDPDDIRAGMTIRVPSQPPARTPDENR